MSTSDTEVGRNSLEIVRSFIATWNERRAALRRLGPRRGGGVEVAMFDIGQLTDVRAARRACSSADVRALFEQVRYALICHKPGDMETG